MRAVSLLVVAAVSVLFGVPAAWARVTPRIEIETAGGAGYARPLTVRVTTPTGKPVRRATVLASGTMDSPGHFMSVAPRRLVERSPGVYRGQLSFIMLGQWVIRVEVSSPTIRTSTARTAIRLS